MKDAYTILRAGSMEDLIKKVNHNIRAGRRTKGGVAVVYTPLGFVFYQAMVKKE